jgi:hypothetical protein
MGVPTSEVGYTLATTKREDHKVHKGHVVVLGEKNSHDYIYSSAGGVPVAVLMKYCSEGDNIPDAVLLCSHLNKLLKLVSIFIHCFCTEK